MTFLDTNILLYAISKAPAEAEKSQNLSEDLNPGQDYHGIRVHNPFHHS